MKLLNKFYSQLVIFCLLANLLLSTDVPIKIEEDGKRTIINNNNINTDSTGFTIINNNNPKNGQSVITNNHFKFENQNDRITIINNREAALKDALKDSVVINDNRNLANVVSSNIIVDNNGATDLYSIQPILLEKQDDSTLIGKNIIKNGRIMSTFINPKFNFLFEEQNKDFDVKTKSIKND